METAVANAIVTSATGLAAPAPVAAPVTTPVVAPAAKTRDEVVRALSDGKGAEQQNDVLARNNDNAATVKVVDTSIPAGDETAAGGAGGVGDEAALGTAGAADASAGAEAQGAVVADAAAAAPPSQQQLEEGTDVGTGDTLFRIRDKDTGQWKPTPTDMIEVAMRDPDTGEVRMYEKSVPDLVRMARDGVAREKTVSKMMPEVKYYRDNVGKWQDTTTKLQTQLAAQMELNREMLSSEEKYLERREQYAQEMAPDKRAERLQAQLDARTRADNETAAKQQLAAQVNGFYQTRIQPIVNDAMKVLPPEMIIGRINADTLPLMVNGVIPPQHWPQYEAYVRGPFAQWAKNEGAKWTQNAVARETSAKAADAAQKANQKTINDQARTMQPVGRVAQGTAAAEPVKLAPPKNKREALERLVSRPLEG